MQNFQLWMPAILALFGSLLVVVITAWLNTKALSAQIDASRSDVRAQFAEFRVEMGEFRLEINRELNLINHRLERLEDQGRLFRP